MHLRLTAANQKEKNRLRGCRPLSRFRDSLTSRHGRSARHRAPGFIASELGRTCGPVQGTASGLARLSERRPRLFVDHQTPGTPRQGVYPPSDVYGTRSWAEWVSTKCAFPYSSAGTSASLIARTRVDIAGGVRTALLWLRRIDGATGRDRRTRSEEVIRVVVGVSGVPAAAGGLAFNALVQADVGKRCSLEPACRL